MKIKEWLKKREQAKYAKREEYFRQMYIQLAQNIQTIQQYKQERLALQSEYKCMDNRFKHLANLISHLQEEVTRLSEELEEEKAKHIQVD